LAVERLAEEVVEQELSARRRLDGAAFTDREKREVRCPAAGGIE
jgi:hypothetical protein